MTACRQMQVVFESRGSDYSIGLVWFRCPSSRSRTVSWSKRRPSSSCGSRPDHGKKGC